MCRGELPAIVWMPVKRMKSGWNSREELWNSLSVPCCSVNFCEKNPNRKKGLFCNDCLWFVTSSKINKNWQQIAMVWERNLEKIETSRHQKHTHIHAHTLANTYVKCKFSHQPNTVCGFIYFIFWDFATLFHY